MPVARNPEEFSSVLPWSLVKELFNERNNFYGTNGFCDGLMNVSDRVLGPLRARFVSSQENQSAFKTYFFAPYKTLGDFGGGLLSGPAALCGWSMIPTATAIVLMLPAIGEFLVGVYSLLKAAQVVMHNGRTQDVQKYFHDGLTRLALSPCLAFLCIIQVPIELARFVSRSVVTLVEVVKKYAESVETPANSQTATAS